MTVQGCTVPRGRRLKPRPPPRWPGFRISSEAHRLGLDHIRKATHSVDQSGSQWLVDLDQRDRTLAGSSAPEVKRRDIDLALAQHPTERANKARLVVIAHKQYVPSEFAFERNTLDIHEARLASGEDGAGD